MCSLTYDKILLHIEPFLSGVLKLLVDTIHCLQHSKTKIMPGNNMCNINQSEQLLTGGILMKNTYWGVLLQYYNVYTNSCALGYMISN